MTRALEGNGAGIVREHAIAAAVQRSLEHLYGIDRVADVHDFIEVAEEGERETLFVREAQDGTLEMSLRLPPLAKKEFAVESSADLDPLCQLIEGVSHFVYLAERARVDREATQLELELQAEVDKYVVLAASLGKIEVRHSEALRVRLYDSVSFNDAEGSELGDRYRMANDLAGKFVRRLERDFIAKGRYAELRHQLRLFFHMGQEEKMRVSLARAA